MIDRHRWQGLLWPPLPSALVRLGRDRLALASLALITALALGAAQTNAGAQVVLTGAVDAHWRGAYDLLVRPPGSTAGAERTGGLVEPDFLVESSGARGISLDALAAIRALPGVALAAPVSVVGYVDSSALASETDILVPPQAPTVYQLTLTVTTSDGLHDIVFNRQTATVALARGLMAIFTAAIVSESGPGDGGELDLGWDFLPPLRTAILGVDPTAEAALLGPRGSVLAPLRQLPAAERGQLTPDAFDCDLDAAAWRILGVPGCTASTDATVAPLIPLIVADRLPAPLVLHLAVEQVGHPVPRALMAKEVADYSTASLDPLLAAAGPGRTPLGTLTRDVTGLVTPFGPQDLRTGFPGSPLPTRAPPNGSPVDAAALLVGRPMYVPAAPRAGSSAATFSVVSQGLVKPDGDPAGTPDQATQDGSGLEGAYRPIVRRPIAAVHFFVPPGGGPQPADPPYYVDAIGTFDPAAFADADRAQDPLAYVPLGAYAPPVTTLVAGPDGRPLARPAALHPTFNPAGLITAPPTAITDLLGATILRGPDPIDAIRVRVAGIAGFDALSQARISRVAAAIRALGLDVQIVAGASPQPVELDVPAYVPPAASGSGPATALGTVRQAWTTIGAAQRVETGLGAANLALLVLALAVAAALAAGLALVRLAPRTAEAAILRAVGWSDPRLFRYLTADALLAGLAVAAVGLAAWAIAARLGGRPDPVGLVIALALAAALPAAALPAALLVLRRTAPGARLGGETWAGVPTGGPFAVRGPLSLGLRAVLARPARSVVTAAGAAVAAAAAALGALAVATSTVGPTALAGAVSAALHPYQLLLLAAIAAAGVLLALSLGRLDLRERAAEFTVLAAAGWRPSQLRRALLVGRLVLALVAAPLAAALAAAGAIPIALARPEPAAALAAGLALSLVAWGRLAGGPPRARRGVGR